MALTTSGLMIGGKKARLGKRSLYRFNWISILRKEAEGLWLLA
jgi:hypothetical protein